MDNPVDARDNQNRTRRTGETRSRATRAKPPQRTRGNLSVWTAGKRNADGRRSVST